MLIFSFLNSQQTQLCDNKSSKCHVAVTQRGNVNLCIYQFYYTIFDKISITGTYGRVNWDLKYIVCVNFVYYLCCYTEMPFNFNRVHTECKNKIFHDFLYSFFQEIYSFSMDSITGYLALYDDLHMDLCFHICLTMIYSYIP